MVERICDLCGEDHGYLSPVTLPNGRSVGLVGPCCGDKARTLVDALVNMTGGYAVDGACLASPRSTPPEIRTLEDLKRYTQQQ